MICTDTELTPQGGEEGEYAVVASGLGFTYSGSKVPALSDLDLKLRRGALSAVTGASGAGKSTLCLTMNGLAPRFVSGCLEGELRVLGRSVRDVPVSEMASDVGIVLQDFEVQLFSTSAELEVAFGLENSGVPHERMRERVTAALREVGLSGFEKRDPSTLSGGEKQRLALAAVLSMQPQLLVLDEPTSDLDPQGKRDVMDLVSSLAGRGRTIVVAEHETDELLEADLVVVLENGRCGVSGRAQEIFRDVRRLGAAGVRPPQLAQLAALLGLDEMPRNPAEAKEAVQNRGYSIDKACSDGLPCPESAPAGAGAVLRLDGVSHSYEAGADAIEDISLEIREGEFVAVVGANGSGKTTMVKHFNRLLLPSTGTVRVSGMDTRSASLSTVSRNVGYVFQNPDHQIFCETVAEELAFGPRNMGLGEDEIAQRSNRSLAAVHLEGFQEADPFALTKGERQRVALASVLVMEPKVIVMDEPTTGLDYTQQRQVMELLAELNLKGHTIVIVTHSLWLAARYARRVVVMHGGRVVADGPTRRVLGVGSDLQKWSLVPPPAVVLAQELGCAALTPEELAHCLGAPSRRKRS